MDAKKKHHGWRLRPAETLARGAHASLGMPSAALSPPLKCVNTNSALWCTGVTSGSAMMTTRLLIARKAAPKSTKYCVPCVLVLLKQPRGHQADCAHTPRTAQQRPEREKALHVDARDACNLLLQPCPGNNLHAKKNSHAQPRCSSRNLNKPRVDLKTPLGPQKLQSLKEQYQNRQPDEKILSSREHARNGQPGKTRTRVGEQQLHRRELMAVGEQPHVGDAVRQERAHAGRGRALAQHV